MKDVSPPVSVRPKRDKRGTKEGRRGKGRTARGGGEARDVSARIPPEDLVGGDKSFLVESLWSFERASG